MVVFAGCQGAGKSTFYRERFFGTHVRVSLDMLKTRNRERQLVSACLEMSQRFVVDNTNPTVADRSRYFQLADGRSLRRIGYFFEVSLDQLLHRNAQRQGKARVPDLAVLGTFRKLEILDYSEGFDDVFKVSVLGDGSFDVRRLDREV
jgi:predicted kinase